MSAKGELFVNEDVKDTYKKELDGLYGKGQWRLNCYQYSDLWDKRNFPDIMTIEVLGYLLNSDKEEKIGEIEVEVVKSIEDDGYGSYIEVSVGNLIAVYDKNGEDLLSSIEKDYRLDIVIKNWKTVKAKSKEEAINKGINTLKCAPLIEKSDFQAIKIKR